MVVMLFSLYVKVVRLINVDDLIGSRIPLRFMSGYDICQAKSLAVLTTP